MGICGSKADPATSTDGNRSAEPGAGTTSAGAATGAANGQSSGAGGSLSLGSLGPVPIGGRDQSFPSVVGPPSLRKQPSHQAVVSMTNLLNGKCRFAGLVTEEDNKDVPVASADGELTVTTATPGNTLVLIVKGKRKWRVTLHVGVSAAPKPADADGEESCPVTAELVAGESLTEGPGAGGAGAGDTYRMSAMDVDVHSMGSLRLIEEVNLPLVHTTDATRSITVRGSISWRLHEPAAPAVAAPAAAPVVVPVGASA